MVQGSGCPPARASLLLPIGLGVGPRTGLVGVGGGFIVVPTLAIGLGFGMREAMGTSIVIVAIVSVCGLASHLTVGNSLDVPVSIEMVGAAMASAYAGAARISTQALGRGFALIVVLVAIGVVGATLAGASVQM